MPCRNQCDLIFSSTANPDLAAAITREQGVRLGRCQVARFLADGLLSDLF